MNSSKIKYACLVAGLVFGLSPVAFAADEPTTNDQKQMHEHKHRDEDKDKRKERREEARKKKEERRKEMEDKRKERKDHRKDHREDHKHQVRDSGPHPAGSTGTDTE